MYKYNLKNIGCFLPSRILNMGICKGSLKIAKKRRKTRNLWRCTKAWTNIIQRMSEQSTIKDGTKRIKKLLFYRNCL